MRVISILFSFTSQTNKWRVTFARRSVLRKEHVGSRASTTQSFAQEKLCLSPDPATICVTVTTRRWLTLSHDTSDRLRRVTATNFVAHTVTSQPGFCQARNAALTDTRMTLCASIMSRTCGPWPCGASGTDVGVNGISASHNKRVSRARATRDPNRVLSIYISSLKVTCLPVFVFLKLLFPCACRTRSRICILSFQGS
jgi:hypothetical protein